MSTKVTRVNHWNLSAFDVVRHQSTKSASVIEIKKIIELIVLFCKTLIL